MRGSSWRYLQFPILFSSRSLNTPYMSFRSNCISNPNFKASVSNRSKYSRMAGSVLSLKSISYSLGEQVHIKKVIEIHNANRTEKKKRLFLNIHAGFRDNV